MKIIVVPSVLLPMPPVKGGAVQNLIKLYCDYNEKVNMDELHVFSINDDCARKVASNYKHTFFHYVDGYKILEHIQKSALHGIRGVAYRLRQKFYLNSIVREIKRSKLTFDLILLENCPQFAIKFREVFGNDVRIYLHLHNDSVNSTIKSSDKVIRSVDKIIAISRFIENRVSEVSEKAIVDVVYNGVQVNDCTEEYCKVLKDKYKITDEDFVVVFSGRLVEEKGVHIVLDAYEKIIKKGRCKIIFCGSKLYGENVIDDYTRGLLEFAQRYPDNLIFTGYVAYDKIASYYKIASVGVLPVTWEEPLSLTVIEYIMFGLPVIASKSGGIPEVVTENEAFLFDINEDLVDNVAQALNTLMTDSTLMCKMGKAARNRSANFTATAYVESLARSLHS